MMRKLIFLLMGFFIWDSALSQVNASYKNEDRILSLNMFGLTSKIQDRAYTASTGDTTEWIYLADYAGVNLSLQSKDSCTLYINYQYSLDRSALGVSTLIDSLSTAGAAGALKSINVLTTALGATWGRFIFTGSALARPEGTTTATYTAKALLKKF